MDKVRIHPDDVVAGITLLIMSNMPLSCVHGTVVVLQKRARNMYVVERTQDLALVAFNTPLRDPQGGKNPYLTISKHGFKYCLWVSVYKLAKHCKKQEE